MDPLAALTAVSPRQSPVREEEEDEDDEERVQCSADLSAFGAMRSGRPPLPPGHQQRTPPARATRMKLALDLDSSFRSDTSLSNSPLGSNESRAENDAFAELFDGETQDDVTSALDESSTSVEDDERTTGISDKTAMGRDASVMDVDGETQVEEEEYPETESLGDADDVSECGTLTNEEENDTEMIETAPMDDEEETQAIHTELIDDGGETQSCRSITQTQSPRPADDDDEDEQGSDCATTQPSLDYIQDCDASLQKDSTSSVALSKTPTQLDLVLVDKRTNESRQASPAKSPWTPNRVALKKREKQAAQLSAELTDSQSKSFAFGDSACKCDQAVCQCGSTVAPVTKTAIRNLEFSFAMPDSQETESQLLDSLPDVGVMASKALGALTESEAMGKETLTNKETASEANDGHASADETSVQKLSAVSRKVGKEVLQSTLHSHSKAKKKLNSLPPSAELTPSRRKRQRNCSSPDAGSSNLQRISETPRLSRASTRSASSISTPNSSTPSVRTRARLLSPLPSNRAYLSRSRTMFKYKFEFCLTGFVKDGESSLMGLIEEHGGKLCDRYQDMMRPNNTKAVVIATPVSWRKLKFLYAVACGIPVVHPEWLHACITAGQILPFDGYYVPSGYSMTTKKFECLPVRQLDIFSGLSFGIPHDVQHAEKASAKSMSTMITFVLKACGAKRVIEDITPSREHQVDVIISDEYTKTCEYIAKRHRVFIKNSSWVTECIVLQKLLNPDLDNFQPARIEPKSRSEDDERPNILAAIAQIGDTERNTLKLHTGELVLADLSGNEIDHFLLFNVCEILSIFYNSPDDSSEEDDQLVMLRVGVLKRSPNSPGLSKVHSRIVEIPASQVKRRVVAVSNEDFSSMKYRDESIFYFEEN